MIINIPLNTGLMTHPEPEDVGSGGNTVLSDYDIDVPGKLVKREALGDLITNASIISDKGVSFVHRITTTDPYDTETELFILQKDDKTIVYRTDTAFANQSAIIALPSPYPSLINFLQEGQRLRITAGTEGLPWIYQYIDRNYFWGLYNPSAGYNMQKAYVRLSDTQFTRTAISNANLSSDSYPFGNTSGIGLDLTANTNTDEYYYKVAPVFDGNQVGLLSEVVADTISLASATSTVPKMTFELDTDIFNKRLTGLRLYRSKNQSKSNFYNILDISTLKNDPKVINEDCLVQNVYHDPSPSGNSFLSADPTTGRTLASTNKVVKVSQAFGGSIGTSLHIGQSEHSITPSNLTGNVTIGAKSIKFDSISGNIAGTNNVFWNNPYHLLSEDSLDSDNLKTFENFDEMGFTGGTSVGGQSYSGSCSLRIDDSVTESGDNTVVSPNYTLQTHSIYLLQFYLKDPLSSNTNFRLYYSFDNNADPLVGTWNQVFNSLPVNNAYTIMQFVVKNDTNTTIKFKLRSSGSPVQPHYVDNFLLKHLYKIVTWNKSSLYGGYKTVYKDGLGLDTNNGYKNSFVNLYNSNNITNTSLKDSYQIQNNIEDIFVVSNNPSYTTTASTLKTVHISENYLWSFGSTTDSTKIQLDIYDKGLFDGATSLIEGVENIDVHYKYGVHLDGRLYVGNVKLDSDGEQELHTDWILFSELNSPDVIPVSNYIKITDMQGGEITGLAKMLGDLVVFMNKGIFRISTPSADPTSWSLVESEQNIGCISSESIVEVEGNIFFAGEDQIYQLDQNFQAIPVSLEIQDVWQGTSNKHLTKGTYDPKKRRIIYQLGGGSNNPYNYYIDMKAWSSYTFKGITADGCLVDKDMNVYVINKEASSTKFYKLYNVTTSSETETTPYKKTGFIALTDIGKNTIVRRVNIRGKFKGVVRIYINNSTTRWNSSSIDMTVLNGISESSIKVGLRADSIALELYSNHALPTSQIDINRVEIEVDGG